MRNLTNSDPRSRSRPRRQVIEPILLEPHRRPAWLASIPEKAVSGHAILMCGAVAVVRMTPLRAHEKSREYFVVKAPGRRPFDCETERGALNLADAINEFLKTVKNERTHNHA